MEIALWSFGALGTMLCRSSKDRGSKIFKTRVELSWEWISLTRMGGVSDARCFAPLAVTASATEPAINSRLEIMCSRQTAEIARHSRTRTAPDAMCGLHIAYSRLQELR